jgi:hypothetical protein
MKSGAFPTFAVLDSELFAELSLGRKVRPGDCVGFNVHPAGSLKRSANNRRKRSLRRDVSQSISGT